MAEMFVFPTPPKDTPMASVSSSRRGEVSSADRNRRKYSDSLRADEELDRIMSSFVNGIERAPDSHDFGLCVACGLRIIGSGNGCEALGHLYHVNCFNCSVCKYSLKGKSYYMTSTNNVNVPICEKCYMITLKKCFVCNLAIEGETIVAKVNKMKRRYHKECFQCDLCSIHMPREYSVSKNKIICINCAKNGPSFCHVCGQIIKAKANANEIVNVLFLKNEYHIECFKCMNCNTELSSRNTSNFKSLGDTLLCSKCVRTSEQVEKPFREMLIQ